MRNRSTWGPLLLSAALIGSAGLACKPASAESGGEKAEFGRLSVDEVEKGISDKSLHVFDNNSQKRFAEGHVPTARWVNYHDLKASDLPSDKTAKLVFYCSNSF